MPGTGLGAGDTAGAAAGANNRSRAPGPMGEGHADPSLTQPAEAGAGVLGWGDVWRRQGNSGRLLGGSDVGSEAQKMQRSL